MKSKSLQLKEKRGGLVTEMKGINAAAKNNNGEYTEEQETRLDAIQAEIADLDKKIKRAEFVEKEVRADQQRHLDNDENEQRRRIALAGGNPTDEGEQRDKSKIIKDFRFLKIARALKDNKPLDGLELEMHQEAEKERRHAEAPAASGYGIPRWVANAEVESRDGLVGTPTAGGNTVATNLSTDLIPVLRPALRTQEMGIRVMSGLVGNVDFPKQTGYMNAAWETETSTADETDATWGKVSLTPKRLAAWTEFSLQLLVQSSLDIENLLRQDLQNAIGLKVDQAVINGTGSGEPTGILTFLLAGNTIAAGTNGGAITREHLVDMEAAIETLNVMMENLGWLTTPKVKAALKKAKTDTGSGNFVWPQGQNTLEGYKTAISTQVPSNLTKGTGTNLHANIFGNWAEYMLGQWGPIFLDLDRNTRIKDGMVQLITNSFWDGDSRHDEAFSAMIDIDPDA